MRVFRSADILLPKNCEMNAWSVVACDQYTSEPEYWEEVDALTEGKPSTRHLILPEAELNSADVQQKIDTIHETMDRYLAQDVFESYPNCYVYVERTISSGKVRRGLVGCVDLEQYDYSVGSESAIRATEGTVLERIPPRLHVRRNAPVELPHVLMLADDVKGVLLSAIEEKKQSLPKLYDFDLMQGGGHITGWLVDGEEAKTFDARLDAFAKDLPARYADLSGTPMLFSVGDGNHSLATAKAYYEELKKNNPGSDLSNHPARWALVELENIHDPALEFEPIHRVITDVDVAALLQQLEETCCAETGMSLVCVSEEVEKTLFLDPAKGELAVGTLQNFLDAYLASNPGEIDYIHGEDVTRRLAAQPNAVGFLVPGMEKIQLFRAVIADGVLPRKTFSMGHAQEKRFYLEGRKIVD